MTCPNTLPTRRRSEDREGRISIWSAAVSAALVFFLLACEGVRRTEATRRTEKEKYQSGGDRRTPN